MDLEQTLQAIRTAIERRPGDFEAYKDYFDVVRALPDKRASYPYNTWLRNVTAQQVRSCAVGDVPKFYELNKKTYLWMAQDDFHSFLIYIEWSRPPEKRFYQPRMRTLKPMVQAFQEIHDGELDLLTVSQPKRTGKSTLGVSFGAFRAGNKPESSSVLCGAKNGLADMFMASFWQILNPQGEYLFYDVFPDARFVGKNEDKHNIHLKRKKTFATLQCRSIHGDITGTTEATPDGLLYMDDMVENEEEAINRDRLDKRWDEVKGDLLGRRLEGCPIISQGTRYSLYDPIGRLQDSADELGWRMKVIERPSLDFDTDESNFEIEIDGRKLFTTAYYRNERTLLGEDSIQWMSQFQQQPFEAKGLLYFREKLRRYTDLPGAKYDTDGNRVSFDDPDAIIGICDPKEKGKDYAFLPAAYVYGQDYYIEDCICDNGAIETLDVRMVDILIRNKVKSCKFESNSAGWRTAEKVADGIKERHGITDILTKRTSANKETKIIVNAPWVKEHCLFKEDKKIERGGDYWRMMKFLTSWNLSGKNKNDDVPDGMAMLAEFSQSMNGATVIVAKRPW